MSSKQVTLGGESEPWKDADTLRELYDGRTQAEVAAYLTERGHDVTAGTISYWMNKLRVNTSVTNHNEEKEEKRSRKCKYHDVCGNDTPGGTNHACDTCVDLARRRSEEARTPKEFQEKILDREFTTMIDHFQQLYERYQ